MAATLVLAGIAIFTAIKLYQTRQGTIAPTAPTSNPAAASNGAAAACQTLAFTLTSSSPTPTPTGSGTPTPTPTVSVTPTPTPVPQCGTSCSTNSDCPSAMICYVGACRNPSCTTSNNCICESATPTPTPTGTPAPGCYSSCTTPGSQDICPSGMTCTTVGGVNKCVNPNCSGSSNCICATPTPIVSVPTTTPSLPTAGSTTPTILGILGGGILLILGIVLVL